MQTFEEIKKQVKLGVTFADIYRDLTAQEYFEEYHDYSGKAKEDIKNKFPSVVFTSEEQDELMEIHLALIDNVARNKSDWLNDY
jgi:hypothetical protein